MHGGENCTHGRTTFSCLASWLKRPHPSPIQSTLTVPPHSQVRDAEDAEDEDEDEDVEHIVLGDRLISIRTSSLEEKVGAGEGREGV